MNEFVAAQARVVRRLAERRFLRTRWVAFGAVIALTMGALGMPVALADVTSGDKSVFVEVTPTRIADTRVDLGITNKLSSGSPKVLQVTGSVPIAPSGSATVVPDGATAVVLNVTAVKPSRAAYVAVRPGNPAGTPTTSSLNVLAGAIVPNAVTVGLPTSGGNAGKIQIWYQASGGPGTTDILVDVVGYYDDHRHDDRYYTKAQVKGLIFAQRTFVGMLQADGTKRDNGAYTSNRSSAGVYNLTFDTTGLGVATSQMPPNVTATPSYFCANGTTLQADWLGYTEFPLGVVVNFSASIRTFNAAAVAADCSTQFHITFVSPPSLVLSEPDAAAPNSPTSDVPAGTPIVCRNEREGPVCEPAG
jgi:hypothetical protein